MNFARPSSRSASRCVLDYQSLEQRQLLATIQVTTFADTLDPNDGVVSIREAIDIANNNGQDDLIELTAGTYQLAIPGVSEEFNQTGDLDVLPDNGYSTTIRGVGIDATIIDANAIDRVIQAQIDSSLRLENISLTGGTTELVAPEIGHRGGAIAAFHARLELDTVKIFGNESGSAGVGGGLYVAGGQFDIRDTEFSFNNSVRTGSAMYIRSAAGQMELVNIRENQSGDKLETIFALDSDVRIRRARIDSNTAERFGGVAIGAQDSQLDLFHVRALLNQFGALRTIDSQVVGDELRFTRQSGFGLEISGFAGELSVTNSLFFDNGRAVEFEGRKIEFSNSEFDRGFRGIQVSTQKTALRTDVTILDTRFDDVNEAIVVSARGDVLITDVIVTLAPTSHANVRLYAIGENVELRRVSISDGSARGIIAQGSTSLNIIDSQIKRTGGVSVRGPDIQIWNSEIDDNRLRGDGGGIAWFTTDDNDSLTIANSRITNNAAQYISAGSSIRKRGQGGAIFVDRFQNTTAQLNILSSTLAGNRSDQKGVIHSVANLNLNLDIHNSILWNNFSPLNYDGDLFYGQQTYNATRTIIDGDLRFDPAQGNLNDNPKFIDYQGRDFRVKATSPAINAGDQSKLVIDWLDVDGDGNTTEFAPDLDLLDRVFGSETDIGAYEYSG